MKNKPMITRIIAVVSPIPLMIFSILWAWIWFFGIGMGLLNYDTVPQWILVCSLLPLFISPVLGFAWNPAWYNKDKIQTSVVRDPFICDRID